MSWLTKQTILKKRSQVANKYFFKKIVLNIFNHQENAN